MHLLLSFPQWLGSGLWIIPIVLLMLSTIFFYKGKRQNSNYFVFSLIFFVAAIGSMVWMYFDR